MSELQQAPWYAKPAAAATGATLTALTMTPFDVIKTRLQTQPLTSAASSSSLLFPTPPKGACCQNSPTNCVRSLHTLPLSPGSHAFWSPKTVAVADRGQIVCLWDGTRTTVQRVNGFWDAAWRVWTTEGFRGLWKGVGTTLLIAVPAQTAYMITYDTVLHTFLPSHTFSPFAAGILARTTISTFFSPLELLRTRLQATPSRPSVPRTLRSTMAGIRATVKVEGVPSLWRGLSPTLWRDVPFSGMYWAGYESGKAAFSRHGYEGPLVAFVSGATSGTFAAIVTSPFDVLKTRRQAMVATSGNSSSTLSVAANVVRSEGYQALFAGLTPRLAKIAPACGIMISCYEGFSKYLAR
ncbi:mitochondrial carrier [Cantharellus anzutake]|uniref:mitochondrial carrier n=1 Tax=Cantharellus anzutake TaxID=1750568 RepID=UPI00190524A4|nr:mitochondrial carrier [Cantharellus anzutake]KAF8328197.1 mitochondrial carrier [Cantharellus anzutake]